PHGDRVKVGDINQDGNMDIIVSESFMVSNNQVYWFQNPGKSLATQNNWQRHMVVPATAGDGFFSLWVGDIDKDGYPDITTGQTTEHTLSVWKNNQDGTFTKAYTDANGNCHNSAKLFDLDGDGDLDIVGIPFTYYSYPQTIQIWRNDGDSTNHPIFANVIQNAAPIPRFRQFPLEDYNRLFSTGMVNAIFSLDGKRVPLANGLNELDKGVFILNIKDGSINLNQKITIRK
ncbi:MAG: VCBS repeat-containing protein, partial [Chitinivibrionales bacterium]|nr:VCBS repeat-containing protein [Chitinivibrionales bacterium]